LAVGARWLRGALAGPGSPCVLFGTRSDRHSVRSRRGCSLGGADHAGSLPGRATERRGGSARSHPPPDASRYEMRGELRRPSAVVPAGTLRGLSARGGIEEIEGRARPRRRAFSRFRRKPSGRVSLGTRGGDAMVALRGAFAPPPAFPPARIARALAVSAHRRLGCRPPAHLVRRKCDGSGRRLVRISPHHFDTEADADEAIEAIRGTLGLPRGGQCESWPLLSWLVV
jgi:hypothetical protein